MIFAAPLMAFFAAVLLPPLLAVLAASVLQPDSYAFTTEFFTRFFDEPVYVGVLRNTLVVAVFATLLTALLAYPVAFMLAKQPPRRRILLCSLLLLPFYTSILVKSFAFTILLGEHGPLNWALHGLFGEGGTASLLFNRTGVLIGLTHDMLPFLVFPLLVSLLAQNPALHRAAEIMGAGRMRIFWQITFPLSLPGLLAGMLLVMVRVLGQFAVPALLGGRQDEMMANLISFQVNEGMDWNMAASTSVVLLAVSLLFLLLARMRAPGFGAAGG